MSCGQAKHWGWGSGRGLTSVYLLLTGDKRDHCGQRCLFILNAVVKAKLSLCLAKHHAKRTYWRRWGIAPCILNLGIRWILRYFDSENGNIIKYCSECWSKRLPMHYSMTMHEVHSSSVKWYVVMVMYDEMESMGQQAVVVYFRVLPRYSRGMTKGKHGTLRPR